jgi:hypothetical protein
MLALGSPEYAAMLQREEEEEARRRLQMATALVDGALVGQGGFAGDGGPATSALLNAPSGVALRADGSVLISDAGNFRIREVDPQGFALYTDLLMQGWSRSYVLSELVNSDEGRSVKPSLRGLKPLVKRYRKAQSRSLRGWYHRAVKGAESDLPQDRLLRAALLAGR